MIISRSQNRMIMIISANKTINKPYEIIDSVRIGTFPDGQQCKGYPSTLRAISGSGAGSRAGSRAGSGTGSGAGSGCGSHDDSHD